MAREPCSTNRKGRSVAGGRAFIASRVLRQYVRTPMDTSTSADFFSFPYRLRTFNQCAFTNLKPRRRFGGRMRPDLQILTLSVLYLVSMPLTLICYRWTRDGFSSSVLHNKEIRAFSINAALRLTSFCELNVGKSGCGTGRGKYVRNDGGGVRVHGFCRTVLRSLRSFRPLLSTPSHESLLSP